MDASLISDIKSLPQSMQEEVKDFVGYLKSKFAKKKTSETVSSLWSIITHMPILPPNCFYYNNQGFVAKAYHFVKELN